MAEHKHKIYSISLEGISFYGRFKSITKVIAFAKEKHYSNFYIGKFYEDYYQSPQRVLFMNKITKSIEDMSKEISNLLKNDLFCSVTRVERVICYNVRSIIDGLRQSFGFVGLNENANSIIAYKYDHSKGIYIHNRDDIKNRNTMKRYN